MMNPLRSILLLSLFVLPVFLTGCVTTNERKQAVANVDLHWRTLNDKFMSTNGAKSFEMSRRQAFVTSMGALSSLGMIVVSQDIETGYLLASAPAPTPLSVSEWEVVVEAETDELRRIVVEEVGILGNLYRLDPTGKDIQASVLVRENGAGSQVQLSFRLLNKDTVGDPVRSQILPTAAKLGVEILDRV